MWLAKRGDAPRRRPTGAIEHELGTRPGDVADVGTVDDREHLALAVNAQVQDARRRAERERIGDLVGRSEHGLWRDNVAVDQVIARDGVLSETGALCVADVEPGAHDQLVWISSPVSASIGIAPIARVGLIGS